MSTHAGREHSRGRLLPVPPWLIVLSSSLLVCGCATPQQSEPLLSALPSSVVWSESFKTLLPSQWREISLRGHTHYHIVMMDGHSCLKAESHASASILLSAVQFDPTRAPWLSWDWRVDQLVDGEDLRRKDHSDAAARIYVYFETKGLPWQKRSLDYVWSATLPVDTVLSSPFWSLSKMIVAESGTTHLRQWQTVERDLRRDYRRCFGADPPHAIAIGLMSDTDSTGKDSLAYFRDVRISRAPLHQELTESASPANP